jgi:hypothetical protein
MLRTVVFKAVGMCTNPQMLSLRTKHQQVQLHQQD